MRPLFPFLLAIVLVMRCAAHLPQDENPVPPPQRSERPSQSVSIGMTREQLRAQLMHSWLLVAAARPDGGWSRQFSQPAGRFAGRFESSHPGIGVEACDVYWIGHTNAPSMYYGIPLNYYYFDSEQKLIGFDKWVID